MYLVTSLCDEYFKLSYIPATLWTFVYGKIIFGHKNIENKNDKNNKVKWMKLNQVRFSFNQITHITFTNINKYRKMGN